MFGRRSFLIARYISVMLLMLLTAQPIFVFAQSASPTPATVAADPFTNATLLDQARKQCQATIAQGGVSSAFNDDGAKIWIQKNSPGFGSPSGNVASYDLAAISLLNFIAAVNSSMELLLKERNFSDDCFKVLNMANAQRALNKELKTSRDDIARNNLNQPDKVAEKIIKKNTEQVTEAMQKADNYQWKDEGLKTISALSEKEVDDPKYTLSRQDVYAKANGTSRITIDDMYEMGVMGNNPYDQSVKLAYAIKQKNGQDVGLVYEEANRSGGIVASRACTETKSGANPEDVEFSSSDCQKWEPQPVIINQERVKQLVNAPYNQALGPSAELGLDGTLANINTRINNGTLFAQNVGDNFGRPGSSTNNSFTDLEKVKNQLINPLDAKPAGTVSVGIVTYQFVMDFYQSATSTCAALPITDRQAVITEVLTKKSELETYKNDLTQQWKTVLANPKADYTTLFLKLTTDFNNKYSVGWIKELATDAQGKMLKCLNTK